MNTKSKIDDEVRNAIISRPDTILDDKDVMHALIAANEKTMGENIIDLRGIAMDRLEPRSGTTQRGMPLSVNRSRGRKAAARIRHRPDLTSLLWAQGLVHNPDRRFFRSPCKRITNN